MSFEILGVGCKAPDYSLDQATTAEVASHLCCSSEEQRRLLKALYRRSGIQRRSSVLLEASGGEPNNDFYPLPAGFEDRGPRTQSRMAQYEECAGRLALEAAAQALESGEVAPRDVTHLITVSCTGFYAPGIDFELIKGLGLSAGVGRANLGFMGCHAALNALQLAGAIAASDERARILIASVEICSLHFQYGWDPDRVVSNALFADGAGALVGGAVPKSGAGRWRLLGSASCLLSDSAGEMTWRIGDHGYLMTLSPQVPKLIDRHLAQWVDEWLDRHQMSRQQIRSWAIHPGGPRILRSARQSLGLSPDATRVSEEILSGYGNMSSATLLFILKEMRSRGYPLPCVALGFGPGLSFEGALFG